MENNPGEGRCKDFVRKNEYEKLYLELLKDTNKGRQYIEIYRQAKIFALMITKDANIKTLCETLEDFLCYAVRRTYNDILDFLSLQRPEEMSPEVNRCLALYGFAYYLIYEFFYADHLEELEKLVFK
ncbi:hypothetical protein MYX76_10520 [Desulfobacterota bacterium AH_259_B03_O07]|nr:hypothetical protein [Desulfobacterota bacterium AH_259_B03_O07]